MFLTLSLADLKALHTFSGVAAQVVYVLDASGRVARAAMFNDNGLHNFFNVYPTPTEADFKGALNFPTAIRVEAIE